METLLKVLLIVVICIAAAFILAIVLTVLYEKKRKESGKKRKENAIWEDRKRTFFGMPWSFTKYSLDGQRFYLERGLFSTRYDEVRLYRMTDVVLVRTLIQKIFGLGTLRIDSSDKSLGDFAIVNIKDSEKVKELFSQKVEEQRKANRVYTRESIGYPEPHDDMDHDGFGDMDDHDDFGDN
ncbi:MAG: PH domain-containing protein [Lachnospiraceae bacterium]|nr:PH domain-containing protein [Lachnospiraceae bacterium]MBR1523013.1 PH domain-containing protein [Lachnospiraceae bacterium]